MKYFDNPPFLFISGVFLKDLKNIKKKRKKRIKKEKLIIIKCNSCDKKSNDKYFIPFNIESSDKQVIKSNQKFCSVLCIKNYINLNYDYFKSYSLLKKVDYIYE